MQQLSAGAREGDRQLSSKIDARSATLIKQTSVILNMVEGTPGAIANLHSITIAQAKQQSRQVEALNKSLLSTTSHLADISYGTFATVAKHAKSMRGAAARMSNRIEVIKRLLILYKPPNIIQATRC